MAECSVEGCEIEALWDSELCATHLMEQGDEAVSAWRNKVMEDKKDLEGANFAFAPLQEVDFSLANLRDAILFGADLQGAQMRYADLHGANLFEANLQEEKMTGVRLAGANLSSANLRNALLERAHLHNVDLSSADLSGADLREADLRAANLQEADLSGSDMRAANLHRTNLLRIQYVEYLRLPESLQGLVLRRWLLFHKGPRGKLESTTLYFIISTVLVFLPYLLSGLFLHEIHERGQAVYFILALWPLAIPLILVALHGRLFPFETLLEDAGRSQRTGDDKSGLSSLIQMIISPTLWRGVSVEGVGRCNPLVLRYIRDQSWLESRIRSSEVREGRWDRLWMFVWGMTSCYGTSIWLWVLWSAVAAINFGLVYWMGGEELVIVERPASWLTYIYFSVVTFTTLGFGDVTPANAWGEAVVMIEVILGYVMLGGLISILSVKLARLAG
jgi:hypothetical protein